MSTIQKETLRAGATTVVLTAAADLRYLSIAGHEAIRRVYAAVRAADWFTVPATVTVTERTVAADSFRIVHDVRYAAPERGIDFRATITVAGTADGAVTFDFAGEAFSEFERARIGLCVLHPAEAQGVPVSVTHTGGDTETGAFPVAISPHQPFFDIAAIQHTVAPGVEVTATFGGEVFEMEDQRNWLDASFKTYSTPQSRPSPVRVKPGDTVRQTVTFAPTVAEGVQTVDTATNAVVMVSAETVGVLPSVGRELPSVEGAVGVKGNFTELNRSRPAAPFDAVYFAGNPQVHADDDLSIMETPATVEDAIRTAKSFADGKPVHVGRLTFAGGYAPDDSRKSSAMGKAWYAATTYHAINAGAAGIATDAGEPIPLATLADATVRAVTVSDNRAVAACAVAGTGVNGKPVIVVHLVNLLNVPQTVRVAGVPGMAEVALSPYEIAITTGRNV